MSSNINHDGNARTSPAPVVLPAKVSSVLVGGLHQSEIIAFVEGFVTSCPGVKFDVIVARTAFQEMVLLVLLALENVAQSVFLLGCRLCTCAM